MNESWTATDTENADYIGILELDGDNGYFEILDTGEKLVFGGACNVGFMESGFMEKDNDFSLDKNLQALHEELTTYYTDGKEYATGIVCNDRM